jgi:hypothetical protein
MSPTEQPSHVVHLTESERTCLQLCQQAVTVCEWCADECLGMGGEMADCVRLCRDVTDVAALHAQFLARGSAHREALAGLCATVCRDCAAECETHDHDHCQACVDVLRDCAAACEAMVK